MNWYIQVASRVAKQLKSQDLRKSENTKKISNPHRIIAQRPAPQSRKSCQHQKKSPKNSYETPPQHATPHENQSRPQIPHERPRAPPHRHGQPQTSHSQPQAGPDPPQAAPSGDCCLWATADAPRADGFGWPKIALGTWRWLWVASGGFQRCSVLVTTVKIITLNLKRSRQLWKAFVVSSSNNFVVSPLQTNDQVFG